MDPKISGSDENPPGTLSRLIPQGRDAISIAEYLIILLVLVWMIVGRVEGVADWRFYLAFLCVTAILLTHVFQQRLSSLFKDQARADLYLISTISILTLAATWLSQNNLTIYLPAMITGMAFRLLQFRAALLLSFIVSTLWLLIARGFPYAERDDFVGYVISLLLGAFLFAVIGLLVRRNNQQTERAQKLASELQDANIELLATRQRDRELAAAEERMQLAREIHDGLGHHLTVLSVQLQVAKKLIEQSPNEVGKIIEICQDEAQAALEEVRRSVTFMRSTPLDAQTLEDALGQLVTDFDSISPLFVSLKVTGDPRVLNPAVSMTCYRVIQEGLTNVQKHAIDASQVNISLEYEANSVRIQVRDDGTGGDEQQNQPAYGLIGLRERAGQLGGELLAGDDEDGGFTLELLIPVE